MKEGFYSITYTGASGDWGFGMIVLDTDQIIGADVAGGRYDGQYQFNQQTQMLDASIRLIVPPGAPLVQGVPPQPKEWTLEFQVSFPRETPETPVQLDTPVGPVNVVLRYLRSFPD